METKTIIIIFVIILIPIIIGLILKQMGNKLPDFKIIKKNPDRMNMDFKFGNLTENVMSGFERTFKQRGYILIASGDISGVRFMFYKDNTLLKTINEKFI